MKNIKKTFKTLRGFKNFVGRHATPISTILNGEFYNYPKRYHVTLEGKALEQFATMLSGYLYMGKEQQAMIKRAVMEHHTDPHGYLQCFYLDYYHGEFGISNSLSGEAFEYCRRKFLKTI